MSYAELFMGLVDRIEELVGAREGIKGDLREAAEHIKELLSERAEMDTRLERMRRSLAESEKSRAEVVKCMEDLYQAKAGTPEGQAARIALLEAENADLRARLKMMGGQ